MSAVDIALIEDSSGVNPPSWDARVFTVVVGLSCDPVTDAIGSVYPQHSGVYEYDMVEFLDQLCYMVESTLGRLIRERPLQAAPMRELARYLARYKLSDRYVLTGCRRRHKDRIELNTGVGELLEELASSQNDHKRVVGGVVCSCAG